MVIPYAGALNFYLAIYNNIPSSIRSLIVVSLFCYGGVSLIKWVRDL